MLIYHLIKREVWKKLKGKEFYHPASLDEVGFIHCSTKSQVLPTAHRRYKNYDMIVLVINTEEIADDIVFEDLKNIGEKHPHIYREIPLDAVTDILELKELVDVENNMDKAIEVLLDAGKWLEKSGKKVTKWWKPENLNRDFLLKYAKEEEFYVYLIDGEPAGARILQINKQNAQDWSAIDKGAKKNALYLHWGCVKRKFAGIGLPKIMLEDAENMARNNHIYLLRLDTDSTLKKLREIHESLGFKLVGEIDEDYRKTAFYEKKIE